MALHQRGETDTAEAIYRNIIASQPKHFEASHALGILFLQRRQYKKAEQQLAHAIKINPNDTSAHNNRAYALQELGRVKDALASYTQAITLEPANAGAYYNRANIYAGLRRFEEALADIDKAIFFSPNNPQIHNNRGNLLGELNRLNDAVASFDKALALNAGDAAAWLNRAVALGKMRRFNDAKSSIERAIQIEPTARAYNAQGSILAELKDYNLAVAAYRSALSLDPHIECARSDYVFNKILTCDWNDIETDFRSLIGNVTNGTTIEKPFVLFSIPSSPAQQLRCAEQFIQKKAPPHGSGRGAARVTHDRIRVGYVSSDLRDHPVGFLTAGMFEEHDRRHFEITAISTTLQKSEIRDRIALAAENFIDADQMGDEQLIALIEKREIDILVDLNGITGDARTNIFAARPSPVQINFLGYPGTMGAPYIDYIVADKHLVSESEERFYAEKIIYLPDTFQPNDSKRAISEKRMSRTDEKLPDTGFVFCCFNNSYKISPRFFDIWMRLLHEIEGSVLWMNSPNSFARENLAREAKSRNISPERIVFAERTPLLADHLARHRLADLFLDTLPYNAHTTASDALWAGLPLLTCRGETFAGRVSSSLLQAAGLPELVTQSLEEYEAAAIRLARDPALLSSLKTKLAGNLHTQPLFDTKRFTRHIEKAYATVHARSEKRQIPRSIVVPPVD